MPPLMRLCAQLCLTGKLAAAAEWANLVRATNILRRSIPSADHLPPLHPRVPTSGSPSGRSSATAHAPSHDFQEAVAHLLHDEEETAAFAAAALLNTVALKRREAQAAHNWDQVYDALVVEARGIVAAAAPCTCHKRASTCSPTCWPPRRSPAWTFRREMQPSGGRKRAPPRALATSLLLTPSPAQTTTQDTKPLRAR